MSARPIAVDNVGELAIAIREAGPIPVPPVLISAATRSFAARVYSHQQELFSLDAAAQHAAVHTFRPTLVKMVLAACVAVGALAAAVKCASILSVRNTRQKSLVDTWPVPGIIAALPIAIVCLGYLILSMKKVARKKAELQFLLDPARLAMEVSAILNNVTRAGALWQATCALDAGPGRPHPDLSAAVFSHPAAANSLAKIEDDLNRIRAEQEALRNGAAPEFRSLRALTQTLQDNLNGLYDAASGVESSLECRRTALAMIDRIGSRFVPVYSADIELGTLPPEPRCRVAEPSCPTPANQHALQ